jgi:xanthine dehydrogenase small subunit
MSFGKVRVNGTAVSLETAPGMNALDWIREQGLTGAKEGCAEGECGACSILVARPGTATPTEWTALNACLMPAAALAGEEVVTAEGLGTPDDLHPVQREMAVRGGSQCGYCTPGFVCSMAAEYYRGDRGDEFDVHALSGNLCRCTGYRPILEAARAVDRPRPDDALAARRLGPPPAAEPVHAPGYARPADLREALELIDGHPGARAVGGSTDVGVEVNLRGDRPGLLVSVGHLRELRELTAGPDEVVIGAGLSLSEVERGLDGAVPLLADLFPQFASRLIRNAATIGGNLGTGSPIGDLPPVLLALDARVVLTSVGGEREVPLASYFTGYRQSVRAPGELIRAVRLPRPFAGIVGFAKIAKRRFDDISSVAIAFAVDVEAGAVRRVRIGLGGVAATPVRALATEAALIDQPWNERTVRMAAAVMAGEGTPLDDHRASAAFRSAMLGQALLKLYYDREEARA